ncbi:MAG: hypothetical protein CL836_02935 [Crocinitomicaceae bacterium]|nr:hypothetical protein [Crocinitomicaceae bacterium]|tara:strand:- start:1963 stop:3135 length:1173 start_codon:yes stop_codon:yes gene_type:complete
MKNSTTLFRTSLIITLLFSFFSCQKKGCTDPNALNYDISAQKDDNSCIYEQFDKQALLLNLNDNYIIPAFSAYQTATIDLDEKVELFTQNPNDSSLITLRNYWSDALLKWQDIAFLNFGPSEYILLTNQTNTFPADTMLIDSSIFNGSWNFSSTNSFDAKGFQAMDYLLNKRGQSDNQICQYFSSSVNAKQYLKDISTDLKSNIDYVVNEWTSYTNDFTSDYETNSDGSAVSNVINALCQHYEFYVRRGKVGLPLGKFNGFSQQEMPELVECYHYGQSLPFAKRSVSSIQNFINGNSYASSSEGIGFDDYIDFVNAEYNGEDLSSTINNKFQLISDHLDLLNDPFSEEIINNKQNVENAYEHMQQLVPLVKVDMTSALGVLITYQDNDGD